MSDSHGYWFPAKKYGWGWGLPCHPMGWLVLLGYVGGITACAFLMDVEANMLPYLLVVFLSTMALLAICWFKGERPSWR